ncbi:MAG: hypothetical protein D6705_16315 [Deltaproteobacteria bacterium]|nr:MAG: hypothetical protein D6705_16315 [Deltaproteobacteria bacterium]
MFRRLRHDPPPRIDEATAPSPDPRLRRLRPRVVGRAGRNLAPPLFRRPLAPGLYEILELPARSDDDRTLGPLEGLLGRSRTPADLYRIARRNLLRTRYHIRPQGFGAGRCVLRVITEDDACPASLALEIGRRLPAWTMRGFLLAAPCAKVAAIVPLCRLDSPARLAGGIVPPFPGPGHRFRPAACAHALATFAHRAHAMLPSPFTPEIFWVFERRLEPVPTIHAGREQRVVPDGPLARLLALASEA